MFVGLCAEKHRNAGRARYGRRECYVVYVSSTSTGCLALYHIHQRTVGHLRLSCLTSAYATFFFGCYQASSNLQYTTVDTVGAIAGISFMLINVRIGLGWAQQAPLSAASNNSVRAGATCTAALGRPYALRPVAIDISTSADSREEIEEISGNKSKLPV